MKLPGILCSMVLCVLITPGVFAYTYDDRIMTVGTESGQYEYTSIVDAIDAIPTGGGSAPTADQPYTVLIYPGTYTTSEYIVIPSYTRLIGKGTYNTIIEPSADFCPCNNEYALVYVDSKVDTGIENLTLDMSDLDLDEKCDCHVIKVVSSDFDLQDVKVVSMSSTCDQNSAVSTSTNDAVTVDEGTRRAAVLMTVDEDDDTIYSLTMLDCKIACKDNGEALRLEGNYGGDISYSVFTGFMKPNFTGSLAHGYKGCLLRMDPPSAPGSGYGDAQLGVGFCHFSAFRRGWGVDLNDGTASSRLHLYNCVVADVGRCLNEGGSSILTTFGCHWTAGLNSDGGTPLEQTLQGHCYNY